MNPLSTFVANPEWDGLIQCAQSFVTCLPDVIETSSAPDAQELLTDIVSLKGQIEKARKVAKDVYVQGGKAVDAEAKRYLAPIEQFESIVRSRLTDYQFRIQAEQRVALEQQRLVELRAAAEAGPGQTPALAASVAVHVPVAAALRTRSYPVLKIYDASSVPDEFWVIDGAKLKAHIEAGNAVVGASIVMETRVVAR